MHPVIHIGPPKTATTSIQAVIPQFGRPYEIKPEWTRALALDSNFAPPDLASDVIISDEALGEFRVTTPEGIATRLATVFEAATIIYVVRDPLDWFQSYYQQKVINTVSRTPIHVQKGKVPAPMSADAFFDWTIKIYKTKRVGPLAVLALTDLRLAFHDRFDFITLEFSQLTQNPDSFITSFCSACGVTATVTLPRENVTGAETFNSTIANMPPEIPREIYERWRPLYENPVLTPDRQAVLLDVSQR